MDLSKTRFLVKIAIVRLYSTLLHQTRKKSKKLVETSIYIYIISTVNGLWPLLCWSYNLTNHFLTSWDIRFAISHSEGKYHSTTHYSSKPSFSFLSSIEDRLRTTTHSAKGPWNKSVQRSPSTPHTPHTCLKKRHSRWLQSYSHLIGWGW